MKKRKTTALTMRARCRRLIGGEISEEKGGEPARYPRVLETEIDGVSLVPDDELESRDKIDG